MARLSPTRMMSTPASSAMRAPGASYAVTITSGVPLPLLARTAGAVIDGGGPALRPAFDGDIAFDDIGVSPPSPSSAPRLPAVVPIVPAVTVRRHVGKGLRELRPGGRRPGRRAPRLRGPRAVGD